MTAIGLKSGLKSGQGGDGGEDVTAVIARVLHGVLALGNVQFAEDTASMSGGAVVTQESKNWLSEAAAAFGIITGRDEDGGGSGGGSDCSGDAASTSSSSLELERVLTSATLSSGNIVKRLDPSKAQSNADTMAKEAYKRLFEWVIAQVTTLFELIALG